MWKIVVPRVARLVGYHRLFSRAVAGAESGNWDPDEAPCKACKSFEKEPGPQPLTPPVEAPPTTATEKEVCLQASTLLVQPEAPARKGRFVLWALSGTVLSVAAPVALGWCSPNHAALISAVVLFHEAAHYVGFRAFGFHNAGLCLIPLFGGVAWGRKHAAPLWQRAVIALLGPLAGIAMALFIYAGYRFYPGPHAAWPWGVALEFMWLSLLTNGLNLLPFVPLLDGWRVLSLMVFSRHAFLQALFLALTALGMLCAGLWLHSWVPYLMAAVTAVCVPFQYRRSVEAANRRRALPDMPPRLEDLNAEQRWLLFRHVCVHEPGLSYLGVHAKLQVGAGKLEAEAQRLHHLVASSSDGAPVRKWAMVAAEIASARAAEARAGMGQRLQDLVACMREAHEDAAVRVPSVAVSVGALALYLAAWVACATPWYLEKRRDMGLVHDVRTLMKSRSIRAGPTAREPLPVTPLPDSRSPGNARVAARMAHHQTPTPCPGPSISQPSRSFVRLLPSPGLGGAGERPVGWGHRQNGPPSYWVPIRVRDSTHGQQCVDVLISQGPTP